MKKWFILISATVLAWMMGIGDFHPTQKRRFQRIEWFYIPTGVGFSIICLIQLKHIWQRKNKNTQETGTEYKTFQFKQWQIDLLKNLPTRVFSRFWGYCCDCYIPIWLRKPLINSYSHFFECNLEEAAISNPQQYDTFNQFFTRQLKPGSRIIDATSTVVSPADATVLSCGCVDTHNFELDQIKGFSYPLKTFVGVSHPFFRSIHSSFSRKTDGVGSCPSQSDQNDYRLYYCTLYLGPGDYHWFHSPTEWTIEHRRYIPGHLFSVNPVALRSINGIFNFNERVLLSGHWQYGPFLYAAIGAYNVGSIKLNFACDQDLVTNNPTWQEKYKDRLYSSGILVRRGESMGRFELGSSLVLVFTAPKDFQFNVSPGEKVQYGRSLGSVTETL